jgi:hypothetical protein
MPPVYQLCSRHVFRDKAFWSHRKSYCNFLPFQTRIHVQQIICRDHLSAVILPFAIGRVCKYRIYLVFKKHQTFSYMLLVIDHPNFTFLLKPVSYFFGNNFVFVNDNKDRVLYLFFPSTSHCLQPHLV